MLSFEKFYNKCDLEVLVEYESFEYVWRVNLIFLVFKF